jgi:membrane-anchored glycerophosphoryl diester phosphodiesterase (GDPDase)
MRIQLAEKLVDAEQGNALLCFVFGFYLLLNCCFFALQYRSHCSVAVFGRQLHAASVTQRENAIRKNRYLRRSIVQFLLCVRRSICRASV